MNVKFKKKRWIDRRLKNSEKECRDPFPSILRRKKSGRHLSLTISIDCRVGRWINFCIRWWKKGSFELNTFHERFRTMKIFEEWKKKGKSEIYITKNRDNIRFLINDILGVKWFTRIRGNGEREIFPVATVKILSHRNDCFLTVHGPSYRGISIHNANNCNKSQFP